MTVGERIKKIRIEKDIQQMDLACKCDISKQTLYKYENNIVTNIPLSTVSKIAKALNVSEAVLMGWEDNAPTDDIVSEHIELISLYEQLNDKQKENVINLMKCFLGMNDKGE